MVVVSAVMPGLVAVKLGKLCVLFTVGLETNGNPTF